MTALGKLPLRYTSDNSGIGLATYESVEPVIGFDKVINASGLASFQNTTYEPVVPKAGTFFKLKNEVSGNYMTATNGTAEGSVKVKTTPTVESIFYVDTDRTLLSYAFGRYLDCENKKLSDVGTKHGGIYHGAQVYGYKENILMYRNNSYWTYGNKNDGASIDRGSTMPNNDKGYNWVFEQVTTLPVTITPAGYATFYSPVAVTLPAEGLKAYYVSSVEDGSAKMTEIVDGVIPANTGVILQGNAGEYPLTIGGSADEVDNKLSGTVASEYISVPSYVLSKQNNVVGFYKAKFNVSTDTTNDGTTEEPAVTYESFLNNGFKAYLPANTGAESRFLVFNFGDDNQPL